MIEAHAERRERVAQHDVIAIDDVLRRDAVLARAQHDRHAVLIRAADERDVAAHQALIAAVDVRGQVSPGDVAEVGRAVRVRKRGRDQEARVVLVGHGGDSSQA